MEYPTLFSHAHVDDDQRSNPDPAQPITQLVFSDAEDSTGEPATR